MKVICNLPNASGLISGVRFAQCEVGMISEEIDDETAAQFLQIPGYASAEPVKPPSQPQQPPAPTPPPPAPAPAPSNDPPLPAPDAPPAPAPAASGDAPPPAGDQAPQGDAADPAKAELEALRVEATNLGIKVSGRWGADRLRTEIQAKKAEKPADEAKPAEGAEGGASDQHDDTF